MSMLCILNRCNFLRQPLFSPLAMVNSPTDSSSGNRDRSPPSIRVKAKSLFQSRLAQLQKTLILKVPATTPKSDGITLCTNSPQETIILKDNQTILLNRETSVNRGAANGRGTAFNTPINKFESLARIMLSKREKAHTGEATSASEGDTERNQYTLGQTNDSSLSKKEVSPTRQPFSPLEATIQFSNGRSFHVSIGTLARMANGSSVVSNGDSNVLVTVLTKKGSNPGNSNLLTVDYCQKDSVAWGTLVGQKGDTLMEKELLTACIVDRSIGPLLLGSFVSETQLVATVLSLDSENESDVFAINGASVALALSNIPWSGPIGAVRVALDANDEVIISPMRVEMNQAKCNLLLSATEEGNITCIEAFANEPIPEHLLAKAIKTALAECQTIIRHIKWIQSKIGRQKRPPLDDEATEQQLSKVIKALASMAIRNILGNHSHDEAFRNQELIQLRQDVLEKVKEDFPYDAHILGDTFSIVVSRIYGEMIFQTGIRCDGRALDQLRPISGKFPLFKSLQGSVLLNCGLTQVLCTATADTKPTLDCQEMNFTLQYKCPLETGGSNGQYQMSHGSLLGGALRPLLPVSARSHKVHLLCRELESTLGFPSMACVAAASAALQNAGVKLESPVVGLAIGLMEHHGEYRLLFDLSPLEEVAGVGVLKVATTEDGFTALQLNCKRNDGIPVSILNEAIEKSKEPRARLQQVNQLIFW